MNDQRLFDLAMKVIVRQATDAERADLDALLTQKPELRGEFKRLEADVRLAKDVLPITRACTASTGELPAYARERLQTVMRQTLGRPKLEKKDPRRGWRPVLAFLRGNSGRRVWVLGPAIATAVVLLLALPLFRSKHFGDTIYTREEHSEKTAEQTGMVSPESNTQVPANYREAKAVNYGLTPTNQITHPEEAPKQVGETPAAETGNMVPARANAEAQPPFPPVTEVKRPEKTRAIAREKFEQSQQAFRRRDFATALKLADDADKAAPNQPATLNLRGEILMQQGQFDGAETAFKKAAKLDPKLRDAQYNLAQIPFKKKEYAKARDRFDTLYKRIPGGEKNQAAELIKFKIYMTYLMEGKESKAHSIMEEFQFTGDTPALYYAQAAWEYKHNNAQKAEDWTNSANKIYSPALNGVFADAFYDVGWLQRPEGTTAPAVAFDSSNVATAQTDNGPAVEPSPIPDKGGGLSLAPSTNAPDSGMNLASAGAAANQTNVTGPAPETNSGANQSVAQSPATGGESTAVSQPVAAETAPPNYTPEDAAKHVGEIATVTGKVVGVHQFETGNIFLNMGGTYPNQAFTAWVPSASASQFSNPQQYDGRTVSVSGKITLYRGKPEIIVTSVSQIIVK